MESGQEPAEARERSVAALESVASNGIAGRELEKAHNRVRSYFLFGMQTNLRRAQVLAEFQLYHGDATLVRSELARYLAVTAADVQRVAGQYFPATNRTVLDVVPTEGAEEGGE